MNPMMLLSALGLGTGLAGNIAAPLLARQRADEMRRALSGPTAAELQAQQASSQAGGIARSIPGMAPAAAAREAGRTLTETSRRLAPARAREEMARAQILNQSEGGFAQALSGALGGIAGGLSSAGALGAVTGQQQAPAQPQMGMPQPFQMGKPQSAPLQAAPAQAPTAQPAAPIQETGDPFSNAPWGQGIGPETPWTQPLPQAQAASPQQMQQDQVSQWILSRLFAGNPFGGLGGMTQ